MNMKVYKWITIAEGFAITHEKIPDEVTGWSTDKLCKMCLLILLGLELNSSVVPLL